MSAASPAAVSLSGGEKPFAGDVASAWVHFSQALYRKEPGFTERAGMCSMQ